MTNSNIGHLEETKTLTENWVIKAPSVGTILAYLETMEDHILFWNKLLFFKIEAEILKIYLKKNFVKPHKISAHQLIQTIFFTFFYRLSD